MKPFPSHIAIGVRAFTASGALFLVVTGAMACSSAHHPKPAPAVSASARDVRTEIEQALTAALPPTGSGPSFTLTAFRTTEIDGGWAKANIRSTNGQGGLTYLQRVPTGFVLRWGPGSEMDCDDPAVPAEVRTGLGGVCANVSSTPG